ncbi:MAG: TadE family type IV pilus minor pilin [Frankiaceae bacterium]
MLVPPSPVRPSCEAGYATAELALTLPVLVLVVLAGLWAVSAVSLKAACAEAVRLGARAAARGEPAEVVRDVVRHELPARAAVTVGGGGTGHRQSAGQRAAATGGCAQRSAARRVGVGHGRSGH